MTRLILVKHAMPLIDEAKPSKDWTISDEGRVAAGRLADRLAAFAPAVVAASTEPKAADTGRVIAVRLNAPIVFDDGLVETRRETVGWLPRAEVEAGLERLFREPGALVYGEETADQAHARFAAAIERQAAAADGNTLIVATHGTVISLWVSRRFGVEPMPLWRSLSLPSAVVVGGDGFELIET
jgi:2,3-bisphosphoglycerate-dependent phosphoglycerate mutase